MSPNLTSTKFLYAVFVVILGFVLVLVGQATAEQWMTFASVIGTTYIIGNVIDKFSPLLNQPKETTQPPLSS